MNSMFLLPFLNVVTRRFKITGVARLYFYRMALILTGDPRDLAGREAQASAWDAARVQRGPAHWQDGWPGSAA